MDPFAVRLKPDYQPYLDLVERLNDLIFVQIFEQEKKPSKVGLSLALIGRLTAMGVPDPFATEPHITTTSASYQD